MSTEVDRAAYDREIAAIEARIRYLARDGAASWDESEFQQLRAREMALTRDLLERCEERERQRRQQAKRAVALGIDRPETV